VEHAVTDGRRRLKTFELFHRDGDFFGRPFFRKLFAETIGLFLLPLLIVGVAGFKHSS
jgi:hypothetical protein